MSSQDLHARPETARNRDSAFKTGWPSRGLYPFPLGYSFLDYLVFSIYLLIYLLVLIYDLFVYLIYILLEGPGEGSQS